MQGEQDQAVIHAWGGTESTLRIEGLASLVTLQPK